METKRLVFVSRVRLANTWVDEWSRSFAAAKRYLPDLAFV